MSKTPDRKALGKGLSALLPGKSQARTPTPPAPPPEIPPNGFLKVPIDLIDPNPVQPRTAFDAERLQELAQSIKANGIIQPLVLQRAGDRYQLVAGERRWRAARLAGLPEVPAIVQDFASDRLLEVALIENIQREDLNAIEVAQALDRLAREYRMSQEEIGMRTGKDRSTVSNLMRLLNSPKEIQVLVAERRLTMGHARALLPIPDEREQVMIANRAVSQNLSVRQVERLSQAILARQTDTLPPNPTPASRQDPNVTAAARELEAVLGTRVRISGQSPDRGRIEIDYFSAEELDRIYNLILGNK